MGDRAGSIPVTRIVRAALSSLESETKGLLLYLCGTLRKAGKLEGFHCQTLAY